MTTSTRAADLPVNLDAPVMTDMHRRDRCRACSSNRLALVLDLGRQPLANAFLRERTEFAGERRYPLELYACEACGLLQLLHVVDPTILFRNYIYVTGTSDTIAMHNVEYAVRVTELLGLAAGDLVLEAASNDGSLLGAFASHGVRTLGIEPARNIAAIANARGIETWPEFFDADIAARVLRDRGPAKAVLANNVLAHVDDTRGFLRSMASLLAPGGMAIFEVPYAGEMLERVEYDTVYHEHLCYFSVRALLELCASAGMVVDRIDAVSVHGGSIRVYARPATKGAVHSDDALAYLRRERENGFADPARHERFARDAAKQRDDLLSLLRGLKDAGKRVLAYGAPAKGNTLLNYCAIGTELCALTFDKSPHKVGTFTPGMHLPVLPVTEIATQAPDYLLLLAWNFADEIIAQQAAFRARGGEFIVPIPTPVIV